MSRRAWTVFSVLQGLGLLCYWMSWYGQTVVGPWVWVGSLVLLLPGNLLASWLVKHVLWGSSLGLPQLGALENLVSLIVNAGVWLLCAWAWKRIRGKPELGADSAAADRPPGRA